MACQSGCAASQASASLTCALESSACQSARASSASERARGRWAATCHNFGQSERGVGDHGVVAQRRLRSTRSSSRISLLRIVRLGQAMSELAHHVRRQGMIGAVRRGEPGPRFALQRDGPIAMPRQPPDARLGELSVQAARLVRRQRGGERAVLGDGLERGLEVACLGLQRRQVAERAHHPRVMGAEQAAHARRSSARTTTA